MADLIKRGMLHTLIVNADLFLREAREVDHILTISVDIQEINTWSKVLHEGAQSPGIDGPVVDSLILIELGVDSSLGLKGQAVGSRDPVPAADLGDEAALPSGAVINGNLDSLYGSNVVAVARVASSARTEDGEECLDVHLAEKLLAVLRVSLEGKP